MEVNNCTHTLKYTHIRRNIKFCLAAIRSVKLQKLNHRHIQDLNAIQVCVLPFFIMSDTTKRVFVNWIVVFSPTAHPWWWNTGLAGMTCGGRSTMCCHQRVRQVLFIISSFIDKCTPFYWCLLAIITILFMHRAWMGFTLLHTMQVLQRTIFFSHTVRSMTALCGLPWIPSQCSDLCT